MDKNKLLKQLDEKGYCEIPFPLKPEILNEIKKISKQGLSKPMINGQMGYVSFSGYKYLFQTLSWSKHIIDFLTHPGLIEVIEEFTEDKVHISNYRIYSSNSSKSKKMGWHTDNKIDFYDEDGNFITKTIKEDKGIILISYLSDVIDGGTQIIEGSHKWAGDKEYWSSDEVESKYKDKIITFNNRKAGTTIIYDYRCVHRAKPYENKLKEDRISAFCQYSRSSLPVGEPILLPTEFVDELTSEQKRLLNFNKKPSTLNWPIGGPWELYKREWFFKKRKDDIKQFIKKILNW